MTPWAQAHRFASMLHASTGSVPAPYDGPGAGSYVSCRAGTATLHSRDSARSPVDPGLADLLARRFQPLVERRRLRGVVAAAITPAGQAVACYGAAGPTGTRLDLATIFEIGSITKTFTALLLASMVEDGEVALDAPIRSFLPWGMAPRPYRGREITLLDLATHTAGLPRLPRNLLVPALLSWCNPCAAYTAGHLEQALAHTSATARIGSQYRYSNFGFGALGHVLSLAASRDYESLVIERVCRPLGLHDTFVHVPAGKRDRCATGHRRGRPVSGWDLGALAGAGGLRSTGADLFRFLCANLAPESSGLAGALDAAQSDWYVARPGAASIGLAWPHRIEGGRRLTWHHGATGGFRSVIAFERAAGAGVIALANSGPLFGMPLDRAAFATLRELTGGGVTR
jgi:D-alanyl-D-alanine-carboxypeptidase/D-alanyl-D-alanine-endopeptidase